MCGWSESNQWDLSFWIIYNKCSFQTQFSTVTASNIAQNMGKGHSLTWKKWQPVAVPWLSAWHRGLEGLAQGTHPSCCLPKCSEWGGEGKVPISQKVCSHFPEAQCHQQKSLKAGFSFGCTVETRPWPAVWWKTSNSLSLASGKTWPFFGELFSPLCPDGIKVWTALLLLWSSRSNEQVPSVLLLLQQCPQNF